MWLFDARLPNSISQKRSPLQGSVDASGPSALDEAANDYERNEPSESLGPDDDSDVGRSTLAGEESWHGICASSVAQVHTSGSRTHKPPTGAEITAIRAAQDLFMSSSFKFQVSPVVHYYVSHFLTFTIPQIDALLPNVRPKDSRKQPIDKLLFSLHACLSSLPSIEPLHPLAASRALSEGLFLNEKHSSRNGNATPLQIVSVPYPLPVPTEDANWKVAFDRPANIAIVGSWINNVAVKPTDDESWVIDVAVEMPSARLSLE
jgi:U3 small nucleolar RNA-associated protein 22